MFQPHGQHYHGNQHPDDDAGNQRPTELADKLQFCLSARAAGGNRYDIIPKQVEEATAHGMIADQQKKEVVPVALSQSVAGEEENRCPNGDGNEAENQIPRTEASLTGAGVRISQPLSSPMNIARSFAAVITTSYRSPMA